ncbi:hypothetical protein [Flexivirga sp. B27]
MRCIGCLLDDAFDTVLASFEHPHRIAELIDGARRGQGFATPDPVLQEVGSPNDDYGQEDQAARLLHKTRR